MTELEFTVSLNLGRGLMQHHPIYFMTNRHFEGESRDQESRVIVIILLEEFFSFQLCILMGMADDSRERKHRILPKLNRT